MAFGNWAENRYLPKEPALFRATIAIGARNEEQLPQNLSAVGWNLTLEQVKRLDAASAVPLT